MTITNRHGLPEAIVRALEADAYSSGGSDATVTTLHSPPRQVILQKKHAGELSVDVSERIASLLGTAFHKVAEMAAPEGDIVEQRFHADILGWNVSGAVDVYRPSEKHIIDWKVLSVWSVTVGDAIDEYTKKLNTYAALMRLNGHAVERLSIVVLFRDWSAREARHNPEYPQQQCIEYPLQVWDTMAAHQHLTDLVAKHQNAAIAFERDGHLVECSKEDQWAKPEKWAVYKGANKRATKLCDSEDEARAYVGSTTQGMRIEHRPSELTRCMHWCPVRTCCEVGKSLEMAAEAAY